MNKEITAVILAGGRGERMKHLTQSEQKCMLPVGGKPILEHIFDNLLEAFGSARVIIATGYYEQSIMRTFKKGYRNIIIEYVHSPERLETRKRLLLAENAVTGPFLYLAGDVIANPTQFTKVVETYERETNDRLLGVISAATDHEPALNHALITVEHGHAVEMCFPPRSIWTDNQTREMGIAFYDKRFFYKLKEARPEQTYLSHVISQAIKQGVDFAVEKYFEKWYHFLKPEDLQTIINFTPSTKK